MTARETSSATDWLEANHRYLSGEMERIRLLLKRRVLWLRRQWARETEADFRGLVISDEQADRLLAGEDRQAETRFYADDLEARRISEALADLDRDLEKQLTDLREAGTPPALDSLAELFDLNGFERQVLLLALAPEIDASFGRLYGYVQDDATRGYATPQLAFDLFVESQGDLSAALAAFDPYAALRYFRLLRPAEEPAGLSVLPLCPSERTLGFLQGSNRLDARLAEVLEPVTPAPVAPGHAALIDSHVRFLSEPLSQGAWPRLNLVGPTGVGKRAVARALCERLGADLHQLDSRSLSGSESEMVALLEREALLLQMAFYVDAADFEGSGELAVRWIQRLLPRLRALFFIGSSTPWQTEWPLLSVGVPKLSADDQRTVWREVLTQVPNAVNGRVQAIVEQYDFGPAMILGAFRQAQGRAGMRSPEDGAITEKDLWDACRERAGVGLEGLAQRIEPCYGWDDMVVPRDVEEQLREIAGQVENRHLVYEEWGFRSKLSRGRGISALFSGPSGTGKTMAAEILAGHLDLDLYRIDLSAVVNKYIGETEKNLRRVFDAAEKSGAVLFFDEADALFGKRTEIKDSHDRYANIQIDYLLQRMEEYRGLAILATNKRSHVDQAFLRRLRFLVELPFPNAAHRLLIWRKLLSSAAPVGEISDDSLARLEIAGGNIRNIVLNAAFLAASASEPIGMDHLLRAAGREYSKEAKMITRAEFGEYFEKVNR